MLVTENRSIKLKKALFLFVVLAAGFSACKKEVSKNIDQDKIWTYFELYYDGSVDKTYATATFRFNSITGTRLMLSDPSTVLVDGAEMEWIADEGYYQNVFDGLKSSAEFRWVDLDGKSFTNSIDIHEVQFPSVLSDLHFGDTASYFFWDGAALDTNESMAITVDGVGNTDARIFSTDSIGAILIVLDSVKLSQVDSGIVSLVLNRRYSPPLLEGTSSSGVITGRFKPDTVSVLLTD